VFPITSPTGVSGGFLFWLTGVCDLTSTNITKKTKKIEAIGTITQARRCLVAFASSVSRRLSGGDTTTIARGLLGSGRGRGEVGAYSVGFDLRCGGFIFVAETSTRGSG
jgi:hypothetical protein